MRRLSVLVVDDEPYLAEEVACSLELAGLTVHTSGSAAEARGLLARYPDIGVMVTDIRMPREDGLALAQKALLGRREADALGVILMTGHGSGEPVPGIVGCIRKPFPMAQMIELVRQTLDAIGDRRGQRPG
jgi:DNA-binding NtrC family response regulator